ncbi:unnamed protein product, partial [Closterium sp. Naga37s-1]
MQVESGACGPFTVAQWQELEQQALIFKYLVAGAPVPLELVSRVRLSMPPLPFGLQTALTFPFFLPFPVLPSLHHAHAPTRSRAQVVTEQKYCERHLHRGRNRARKLNDKATPGTSLVADDGETTPTATTATTATMGTGAADGCLTSDGVRAMESVEDGRGASAGGMGISGGAGGVVDRTGSPSSGNSGGDAVAAECATGRENDACGRGAGGRVGGGGGAEKSGATDEGNGEPCQGVVAAPASAAGAASEPAGVVCVPAAVVCVSTTDVISPVPLPTGVVSVVSTPTGAVAGGHPPPLALPPPAHALEGRAQQVPQQHQQEQQQQRLPAGSPLAGSLPGVVSVVQPSPKLTQSGSFTQPNTLASPPAVVAAIAGASPQQQKLGSMQGSIKTSGAAATLMKGDKPIGAAPMDVDAQKQGSQVVANGVLVSQARSDAGARKEVEGPTGVSGSCNEEVVIVDGKDACRLVPGEGAKMGRLTQMCSRASPNVKKRLSAERWEACQDEFGRVWAIDAALKHIQRGGVEPSIRGEVWPFLLGLYSPNSTHEERDAMREARRDFYARLKQECNEVDPVVGSGVVVDFPRVLEDGSDVPLPSYYNGPHIDDPSSTHAASAAAAGLDLNGGGEGGGAAGRGGGEGQSAVLLTERERLVGRVGEERVRKWRLGLHQIGVDVQRADRTLVFYEEEGNRSRLMEVLAVYSWFDPDVGYCQGGCLGLLGRVGPLGRLGLHQIGVDVQRADRTLVFYEEEGNRHLIFPSAADVMSIASTLSLPLSSLPPDLPPGLPPHQPISPRAGMSDLMSPFIVTFPNNADAFWCFERLLRPIVSPRRMRRGGWVGGGGREGGERGRGEQEGREGWEEGRGGREGREGRSDFMGTSASIGVQKEIDNLKNITRVLDPELFAHLDEIGAGSMFFTVRPIMAMFRRELSFADSIYFWE